jgi:hypothetical protein
MKTRRRFDLIPWAAIREASHILDFGAVKHGIGTWKTISAEVHLDAAMSHIGHWLDGQKIDPESGRSHLQHALIRVLFAVALELEAALAKRLLRIRVTTGASSRRDRSRRASKA